MKILDPHLQDGVHEWRDGKRFVKEGDKLYLEGTNTLAGRCVALCRDFTSDSDDQQCCDAGQVCSEFYSVHGV